MARRRLLGLSAAVVLAAACSGSAEETATSLPQPQTTTTAAVRLTTVPPTTVSATATSTTQTPAPTTFAVRAVTTTTTTPRTTSTTGPPSTTTPPPPPTPSTTTTSTTSPPLSAHLLITAPDGVYHLAEDGATTLLLDGPVAFATDDTRGGLLFQLDRGRNWNNEPVWESAVWWLPPGSANPHRLVVPEPDSGHELSLHDAYPSPGGFTVVFTSHEGTYPNVDVIDRLRSYDVSSDSVVDLYRVGFEIWIDCVSVNAGTVALTVRGQAGWSCELVDTSGNPHSVPGVPPGPPCDDECPGSCAVSHDGTRLAFHQIRRTPSAFVDITLVATDTGEEVQRIAVRHSPAQWGPGGLETADRQVLLNRRWENIPFPAFLLNLDLPDDPPIELPMAGRTQWIDVPISIAFPVPIPTEPGG